MEFSAILGGATGLWSAFLLSLSVTFAAMVFSRKLQVFMDRGDAKKPQKVHSVSTPRSGGIGIFAGLFPAAFWPGAEGLWFFAGLCVVFLSGILEDFYGSLGPKIRMFMQLLGSAIAVFGIGANVTDLSPLIVLPYGIGVIFTLFALIGVCNSINVIDGLNGLSSGICLTAFCAIAWVAHDADAEFALFLSLIGLGATLGFFVLNFPKGRIFLGDGGAYGLGFTAALLAVILTQKESSVSAWFGLAVMIYPTWEVVFSVIRRLKDKKPAMQPDKKHLHMLILEKTGNNPMSAFLAWLFNLPFTVLAVIFRYDAWVLMGICAAFMAIYALAYAGLSKAGNGR